MQDLGMMGGDEPHAAHVRGESVDVLDAPGGLQRRVRPPEIEDLELVGVHVGVFGVLQIDASHPVTIRLETAHQVVPDETSRARYTNPLHVVSPRWTWFFPESVLP